MWRHFSFNYYSISCTLTRHPIEASAFSHYLLSYGRSINISPSHIMCDIMTCRSKRSAAHRANGVPRTTDTDTTVVVVRGNRHTCSVYVSTRAQRTKVILSQTTANVYHTHAHRHERQHTVAHLMCATHRARNTKPSRTTFVCSL